LSNVDEGVIKGLTVRIDRDLCVGFGDCIDLAPEVFDFDEDGVAFIKEAVDCDQIDQDTFLEACSACPVDAITVLNAGGEQLAP